MKCKIWIAIGVYVLTGVSPAVLLANQETTVAPAMSALGAGTRQNTFHSADTGIRLFARATGEGSEADKTDEASTADVFAGAGKDEAFMGRLLTFRSHIQVAKELVEQGRWDDAVAHFSHPGEELSVLYESFEGELVKRDLQQFAADFDALGTQVEARSGGSAFENDYAIVDSKIEDAIASIPNRTSSDFALRVTLLLLKQAAQEYRSAVTDDKITEVPEYQDSWGLAQAAEELVEGASGKLHAKNAAAYQRLKEELAELGRAWPSVIPPITAAVTPGEVSSAVSRVERIMRDLKE